MKRIVIFVAIWAVFAMCLPSGKATAEEESEESLSEDLAWLAAQQNIDGSWGDSDEISKTTFAVRQFEEYAVAHGISPFDPTYQYYSQIQHGLDFIWCIVCGMPISETIYTILCLVNTGVDIWWPCNEFKCVRGDINLNHIAYEISDVVLFARALVFGPNVIFWEPQEQICATDINANCRSFTLSDLIYLVRVIQHDVVPYSKLGRSSDVAHLIISDGRITVECVSPIGALLFGFDGAVTPTLLDNDMELIAHEGKVLVWSTIGDYINAGVSDVLGFTGARLISVTAVDRESRDLRTAITTAATPSPFPLHLHSAYPNPFNSYTHLSFTSPNPVAYNIKIYNVAGQLVRSYEGMGNVGLNRITWDGKDNVGADVASGVYFYKLTAGRYHAINKMVMLK